MTDEERLLFAGCIVAALVLEPIFGYRSAMLVAGIVGLATLLRPIFRKQARDGDARD